MSVIWGFIDEGACARLPEPTPCPDPMSRVNLPYEISKPGFELGVKRLRLLDRGTIIVGQWAIKV